MHDVRPVNETAVSGLEGTEIAEQVEFDSYGNGAYFNDGGWLKEYYESEIAGCENEDQYFSSGPGNDGNFDENSEAETAESLERQVQALEEERAELLKVFEEMQIQAELEKEKSENLEREKSELEMEKDELVRMGLALENRLSEIQDSEKRKKTENDKKELEKIWKEAIKESSMGHQKRRFWKPPNIKLWNAKTVFHEAPNPAGLPVFAFATMTIATLVFIGGVSFIYKGLSIKGKVLGISKSGYDSVSRAVNEISGQNFEQSSRSFDEAVASFSEASSEVDKMGLLFTSGSKYFPYISKISSGKNVLEAGKHLSLAAKQLNGSFDYFYNLKDSLGNGGDVSMLEVLQQTEKAILPSKKELELAAQNLEEVKTDDLPEELRDKFSLLRNNLPKIVQAVDSFSQNSQAFADMLGANGPRKYLFLFQNNNEMRATGGFIGSYGLMDISDGRVRNFFIDGIFNPDGQLTEKIVPPKPIQKISAAWSLHDSNWFPDFPTSAKKAIIFYEKTGGPTADGVIAVTPVVLERLLEITGPIEMKEYGLVLDSRNLVEKTQLQIETEGLKNLRENESSADTDFGKKVDDPKKILADLAPMVLDKVLNSGDQKKLLRAAGVIMDGLSEKHILIYSENEDLQKIIAERGWSGKILEAKRDYLSVINTNINGFKTDGVIEERIQHQAQISEDGSIIDKVSITRKHNGGNTEYEWWNKVNANYMRVYVPKGSRLISVDGQTREFNDPPLEYERLGFKKDLDLVSEEENMKIDEKTGTRIYDENGKTVFANWTYVSPQEEMTITYEYELPFKTYQGIIKIDDSVGSYSLLVQKQSGSKGSFFQSEILKPQGYVIEWQSSNELRAEGGKIKYSSELKTDKFIGIVVRKK